MPRGLKEYQVVVRGGDLKYPASRIIFAGTDEKALKQAQSIMNKVRGAEAEIWDCKRDKLKPSQRV